MPQSESEEKETSNQDDLTVYEVGYLLQPLIAGEDLGAEITTIKNVIDERGGLFISEGWPEQQLLSYAMTHEFKGEKKEFDSAHFGWIKFEVAPEKIPEIQEALKENENIIRFILVKTVREDTLARTRPTTIGEKKRAEKKGRQEKEEISEEKVDQAIEEMIS